MSLLGGVDKQESELESEDVKPISEYVIQE